MERTAAALARRGQPPVWLAREARPQPFDVLHAFSSAPDVAPWVTHWRRNAGAPLVLSPVTVVAPGHREWRQRIGHRLPLPEFGPSLRRDLMARAAALVALTEHEARLLRRLGAPGVSEIVVIANGADPVAPVAAPAPLPDPFVLLLGAVDARKRQHATVLALAAAGGPAPVVIGGFRGPSSDRAAFAAEVDRAGGVWLGELQDERAVRAVIRTASALVHLSTAEGQSLAVLEALAEATPVVAGALPANRELERRFPGWLALIEDERSLPAALATLRDLPPTRPDIPTWDTVAGRLEDLYLRLVQPA